MTLKNQSVSELVWFKRHEQLDILNWIQNEIKVPLAPNMAIRYLCMKALNDKKLRKRATERINLMFEENAQKGVRKHVKCCEACEYKDYPGVDLNAHRVGCEVYQKLVKDRIDGMMLKELVIN